MEKPIVCDFNYKGFDFSTVKYSYSKPNLARMFLEDIGEDDWWCGYVFLTDSHKYNGKHYDDIPIECHGSLTFANSFHIEESDNHNKFAIGFDFNHYGDNGGSEILVIEECKKIIDSLQE